MTPIKPTFISHKDVNLWYAEDNTGLYPEGCHTYYVCDCLGWDSVNNKTDFIVAGTHDRASPQYQEIRFVQKTITGAVVAGITTEQLLDLIIHRHTQMNSAFPSSQNEEFLAHIASARELLADRVRDRVNRGVMGELKK